jgi:tryptophan halogenase
MFPATGFSAPDIEEYNRQARYEFEDVRDFIIAHYKITRRTGDPFWDHVRTMDVPNSLNARFDLFRSSGRFFKHNAQELFAEESWVQVLLGQGFEMKADPVTRFVGDDEIVGFLGDLEEVIADVAKDLPDHGEFVRRLAPSTAAALASASPNVSFNLRYERGETVQ